MQTEDDRQAILLLCAPLPGAEKPLTPAEYNHLAKWLRDADKRPGDLLLDPLLAARVSHPKLSAERVQSLLDRKLSLGLEDWSAAGLWAMARSDPDYPARWKRGLGRSAPPLLFGAGPRTLLSPERSLGVVGSRDCSPAGLAFARMAGRRAAEEGFTLVSGGARGVDREAMQAAFDAGGRVVGVLADSLRKEALSRRYREMVATGRMALVSPFGPDVRFTVGNAMGRNRLIYTLSDAVVIADSDTSGGTWSGAVENLKQMRVSTFVRSGPDEGAGNSELRSLGAKALAAEELKAGWGELFLAPRAPEDKQLELFA